MYNYPYYMARQNNPQILSSAWGDVNGDRIPDRVFLQGIKTPGSPFVQKITLGVQDGRTGNVSITPLKSDVGYNPTVTLFDFTGEGVQDILIGIASGGSGGIMYYYIYSYLGNKPEILFDYNVFNEKYDYQVTYRDFYKVEVIDKVEGLKYALDITYKGKDYLNEIYEEDGRLKTPIEGFVNPLSGLYPIDFNADGRYELLAYQRIAGRYNADGLGFVQTALTWKENEFSFLNQYASIPGSEVPS